MRETKQQTKGETMRTFNPSHDVKKLNDYRSRKEADLDGMYANLKEKRQPEEDRRAESNKSFAQFVADRITDWGGSFEGNGIDAEALSIEFAKQHGCSVQDVERCSSWDDAYISFQPAKDICIYL